LDPVLQKQLTEFSVGRELEHLKPDQLFETFAAFCLVSQFREGHFDPDLLRTGGPHDQGIDGFAILINGEVCAEPTQVTDLLALGEAPRIQIIAVQAKLTDEFAGKVFTELAVGVERVFKAAELPPDCSPKIVRVRECVDSLFRDRLRLAGHLPALHLYYVTPGKPSSRRSVLAKRDDGEQQLAALTDTFKSVRMSAIGGDQLRDMYKRSTEALRATLTIPRQRRAELPATPGVSKGLLGTVAANDFVENLLRDGSKAMRRVLFDDNVRDWLGAVKEDSVNAQIQESLKDPETSLRFVVMNNGVTILAKSVELVKDSVILIDPRIVNGCQTSNVLFDAHLGGWLDDRVMLAVRIYESEDRATTEDILIATNRQNSIDADELEVRSALHREIEQHFEAQPPARRMYYERRPGQYRRRDIVHARVVERVDLARAYAAAFLGDNSRLWRSDLTPDRARQIFDPENAPVLYYMAASAHFRLDWLFKKRPDKLGELRPAKYVLIRALSLYLLGPAGLPAGRVERKARCADFIETLWTDDQFEGAVDFVTPALWAQVDRVKVEGGDLQQAARSQLFGDLVCTSIRSRT
jgi:AIPR protein